MKLFSFKGLGLVIFQIWTTESNTKHLDLQRMLTITMLGEIYEVTRIKSVSQEYSCDEDKLEELNEGKKYKYS